MIHSPPRAIEAANQRSRQTPLPWHLAYYSRQNSTLHIELYARARLVFRNVSYLNVPFHLNGAVFMLAFEGGEGPGVGLHVKIQSNEGQWEIHCSGISLWESGDGPS